MIGHNCQTIHRICTKFDARICLWTPVLCAKFQGDRSTILRFIAIFASVQKQEDKKYRKTKKKSKRWQLASRKWLERFPSHLVCGLPWLAGNSVASLAPIG